MKEGSMMKKVRKYSQTEKQKAVQRYQSGKKTAKEIAAEFNSADQNLVHRWKYELTKISLYKPNNNIEK